MTFLALSEGAEELASRLAKLTGEPKTEAVTMRFGSGSSEHAGQCQRARVRSLMRLRGVAAARSA